jgi:hypothetical protein
MNAAKKIAKNNNGLHALGQGPNGRLMKDSLNEQIAQLEADGQTALVNHHRLMGAAAALRNMLKQIEVKEEAPVGD